MRRLLVLIALVVAPSAAATPASTVLAVAQDGSSVAWLASGPSGCTLHIRSATGATGVRRLPACVLPGADLVSASGRWAWGGYEDVRCSETTAAVYAGTKLVQEIPGDCLGYGTSFQGLAGDGHAFFYSLLVTKSGEAGIRCANGGPCRWRLAGGKLVRVLGGEVSGLPPAALIAGAPGRLALVQAAASAASNGKTFDWPRPATDGRVDVRDTATGKLVTSFRPRGVVRAVALSSIRCVVLVESGGMFRIEWYDSDTGERLGAVPAPWAERLSTDGRLVAYSAGGAVHVLDLETGTQRIVGRGATTGASVLGHRIVWGARSRILEARA